MELRPFPSGVALPKEKIRSPPARVKEVLKFSF